MGRFENLEVWQRSHKLTLMVYRATQRFPVEERYGITSQIRRAASSIPANLAEGCGRGGDGHLAYFISVALGSSSELEYHLLLCRDLQYLEENGYNELVTATQQVGRMLSSLLKTVQKDKQASAGNRRPEASHNLSQATSGGSQQAEANTVPAASQQPGASS